MPSILIATPREREIAEVVAGAAASSPRAFTDLSLAETMALIDRGRLFIGNDSGPAHLAAARRVPMITLFGSTPAWRWRPWTTAPNRALLPTIPRSELCGKTGACRNACSVTPRCMEAITVAMVLEAAEVLLAETAIAPRRLSSLQAPALSITGV